jgi:hypothetical protein
MKNITTILSKFQSFMFQCRTNLRLQRFVMVIFVANLFVSTPMVNAQGSLPEWNWANQSGGSDYNNGNGITTDSEGNVIVTGYFQGQAVFGTTTLTCLGVYDVFVAKYDNLGNVLWAVRMGGSDNDYGYSVATDLAGNIYVAGHFQNQIVINGETINCYGWRDMFVAKISSGGSIEWFRHGGGDFADGFKIAVNDAGLVAVTGYFYSTLQFSGSTLTLTSFGEMDIFIALYNTLGQLQWVNGGGGIFDDQGKGINIDEDGNVLCTGYFYGPATFGNNTLESPEYSSHFCLLKLDINGNYLFAKSYGSDEGGESPFGGLGTDNEGNIYIGGIYYSETFLIGDDILVNSNYGYFDIFLIKFDTSGNPIWGRSAGGTGLDYCRGIDVDSIGNCYISGNFEATAMFGDTTITVVGNTDVFVAKYNENGGVDWAIQSGGTSTDISESVAVRENGDVYATGYFYDQIAFGNITLSATCQQPVFVAKLSQDVNVPQGKIHGFVRDATTNFSIETATLIATSADNEVQTIITPFGSYYSFVLAPGAYSVTCMAEGYLPLTATDLTVVANDNLGHTFYLSPTDQITGIVNRKNADYSDQISIYPNPFQNSVLIKLNDAENTIKSIKILDSKGMLIGDFMINLSQEKLDLSGIKPGYYTLIIQTDNNIIAKKIIKE